MSTLYTQPWDLSIKFFDHPVAVNRIPDIMSVHVQRQGNQNTLDFKNSNNESVLVSRFAEFSLAVFDEQEIVMNPFVNEVKEKFPTFFRGSVVLYVGLKLELDVFADCVLVPMPTPVHACREPDASYDVVCAEFQHDEFFRAAVRNLARLTKPHGLMFCTVPATTPGLTIFEFTKAIPVDFLFIDFRLNEDFAASRLFFAGIRTEVPIP